RFADCASPPCADRHCCAQGVRQGAATRAHGNPGRSTRTSPHATDTAPMPRTARRAPVRPCAIHTSAPRNADRGTRTASRESEKQPATWGTPLGADAAVVLLRSGKASACLHRSAFLGRSLAVWEPDGCILGWCADARNPYEYVRHALGCAHDHTCKKKTPGVPGVLLADVRHCYCEHSLPRAA